MKEFDELKKKVKLLYLEYKESSYFDKYTKIPAILNLIDVVELEKEQFEKLHSDLQNSNIKKGILDQLEIKYEKLKYKPNIPSLEYDPDLSYFQEEDEVLPIAVFYAPVGFAAALVPPPPGPPPPAGPPAVPPGAAAVIPTPPPAPPGPPGAAAVIPTPPPAASADDVKQDDEVKQDNEEQPPLCEIKDENSCSYAIINVTDVTENYEDEKSEPNDTLFSLDELKLSDIEEKKDEESKKPLRSIISRLRDFSDYYTEENNKINTITLSQKEKNKHIKGTDRWEIETYKKKIEVINMITSGEDRSDEDKITIMNRRLARAGSQFYDFPVFLTDENNLEYNLHFFINCGLMKCLFYYVNQAQKKYKLISLFNNTEGVEENKNNGLFDAIRNRSYTSNNGNETDALYEIFLSSQIHSEFVMRIQTYHITCPDINNMKKRYMQSLEAGYIDLENYIKSIGAKGNVKIKKQTIFSILKTILNALLDLYNKRFLYLDLKLENIMFFYDKDRNSMRIKFIDLGSIVPFLDDRNKYKKYKSAVIQTSKNNYRHVKYNESGLNKITLGAYFGLDKATVDSIIIRNLELFILNTYCSFLTGNTKFEGNLNASSKIVSIPLDQYDDVLNLEKVKVTRDIFIGIRNDLLNDNEINGDIPANILRLRNILDNLQDNTEINVKNGDIVSVSEAYVAIVKNIFINGTLTKTQTSLITTVVDIIVDNGLQSNINFQNTLRELTSFLDTKRSEEQLYTNQLREFFRSSESFKKNHKETKKTVMNTIDGLSLTTPVTVIPRLNIIYKTAHIDKKLITNVEKDSETGQYKYIQDSDLDPFVDSKVSNEMENKIKASIAELNNLRDESKINYVILEDPSDIVTAQSIYDTSDKEYVAIRCINFDLRKKGGTKDVSYPYYLLGGSAVALCAYPFIKPSINHVFIVMLIICIVLLYHIYVDLKIEYNYPYKSYT